MHRYQYLLPKLCNFYSVVWEEWVISILKILLWAVQFQITGYFRVFGIFQKCLMVVPKETKSQSECVDWFRSNQVEIFNKGGIADIGPSFHAIELLSRELLQYLKSQKSPWFVFLLISSSYYSCVRFMIILQWPWFDCLANSD